MCVSFAIKIPKAVEWPLHYLVGWPGRGFLSPAELTMLGTVAMSRPLPNYLGFGDLDPASVREADGKTEANYTFGGDVVHTVRWSEGQCQLQDFWRGDLVGISGGPDLRQALFSAFMSIDGRNDPRFADLSARAVAAGNVHFRFPGSRPDRMIFYPGALLFLLRLPVPVDDAARLERARATLSEPDPGQTVRPMSEQPGVVLRLRPDGEIVGEALTLFDATTRLGRVAEASQLIARCGAIRPEKRFRLMIVEASEAGPEHVRIFPGMEPGNSEPDVAFMAWSADSPITIERAGALLREHGPRIASDAP